MRGGSVSVVRAPAPRAVEVGVRPALPQGCFVRDKHSSPHVLTMHNYIVRRRHLHQNITTTTLATYSPSASTPHGRDPRWASGCNHTPVTPSPIKHWHTAACARLHPLAQSCPAPATRPRDCRPGRCRRNPPTDSSAPSAVQVSSTPSPLPVLPARASRCEGCRGEDGRASQGSRCSLMREGWVKCCRRGEGGDCCG